jgi:transposase InsO family protein
VLDLYSRRLLGYAMSANHDAALAVASLQMAAATRGGDIRGVIFHSDRGREYTARHVRGRLHPARGDLGRVGCALDNAAAEALNSTVKVEFIHRQHFITRGQARHAIAGWITEFYNTRRRHSACGWQSPIDYEHGTATLAEAAQKGAGRAMTTASGHPLLEQHADTTRGRRARQVRAERRRRGWP